MNNRIQISLSCAGLAMAFFAGAASVSAETKKSCYRDANVGHRQCVSDCDQAHRDDHLICSAFEDVPEQECLIACTTDREACLKPAEDTLKGCKDACFDLLEVTNQKCEENDCKAGRTQCNICKFTAKVDRYKCDFVCQQNDKDEAKVRRDCRKDFRKCITACRKD